MRKTLNRVLACFLSVALLVSCCISGLVLPAAAKTTPESSVLTNLFPDDDFGEEFASRVTISNSTAEGYTGKIEVDPTAGINGTPALKIGAKTDWHSNLSIKFDEPLKAGKYYILRVKSKGAGSDGSFYIGPETTAQYNSFSTTRNIRSNTEWSELQTVFVPSTDITNLTGLFIYNNSTEAGYLDDFRIYEYVPGMNFYPDEWEPTTAQPYMYSGTNSSSIFASYANNVYEKESAESSNYVQKFTAGTQWLKFGTMTKFVGGIIQTNQPFFFSFKYKGVESTATATITAAGANCSVLESDSGTADEDGWKTFSALLSYSVSNTNWQWQMNFTGATTIMVDDIFVGEPAPEVTPTIDITEATQTVEEGKTVTLNAAVTPADKAIEWTSSDNAIATVANGVVTGVKAGTATITAKVADGITDTCTVTVTETASIQNLITNGDLEGAEWTGNNIVSGQGYGGGKAIAVTSGTTTFPAKLQLKEALDPDKYYVFRVKVKGDMPRIWASGTSNFMNMNPSGAGYTNGVNGTDWLQCQTGIFKPSAAITTIPATGETIYLYKTNTIEGSTVVYYDDFEIFEYVPGESVVPGADGELLPLPNGGSTVSIHHHFYDFFSNGATLSLHKDGENSVWKLDNLSVLPSYGPILRTDILAGQLTTGETGRISFRYKGEGASVNIVSGNVSITKDVKCQTSAADENGWKTVTADFTFITANHNGGLRMVISGANSILIDDFSYRELTEADIDPTVDIAESSETVRVGNTVTLNATVVPSGKAVEWTSSDNTIATVADGVVTGVKVGTVTITAKVADGVTDTCTVTVKEALPTNPATEIILKETTLHLAPKAYHILRPKAGAGGGQVGQINWSSNATSVATVDADGKVTAKANGTAVITGVSDYNPELTVTCTVTVDEYGNRLSGGDFEGETNSSLFTNYEATDGGFVEDPTDATNGVFKLNSKQHVYLNIINGTNLLKVNDIYILSGRVKGAVSTTTRTGTELYVNTVVGSKYISGASSLWITPTLGTDGTEWSYFEVTFQLSQVSPNYTITLQNFGETEGYYDDIKLVKRVPPAVESFEISSANNSNIIALGDAALGLTAAITPNYPDVIVGELTWTSSNPAVATVSKTGDLTADVTAVALGETTITVQNPAGVKATYTISVRQPATAIDITENNYTFGPEGMHGLTVKASPAGTYFGNLLWSSSDENVVTVENGVIKGVAPGTATVTATSGVSASIKDTITVVVTEYGNMLAGGNFEDDTDLGHWASILDPNGKAGGSIIVDPDNANNHVLTFKSNPSPDKAFYQYVGYYKLLGLEPQTTYILTGKIKGNDKPAIGLAGDYVEHTTTSGTAQWNYPEGSKEEWKEFSLVFKTKGNAADGDGKILGFGNFGVGTCLFDDLKLAKQPPQTITALTMLKTEATYGVGVTTQMNYTTTPENADLSTLQWSSSNESVATVDQNGKVTTLAAGKTTITLKSSDTVKATCELTVVEKATSFVLSKNALALIPGATDTLTTVTTPYGAAIPGTLTWSSSDNAVATVANGVVTAVADGVATITCTNGTLSASCTVKVSAYGELIIGGDFQDETLPSNWASLVNGTAAEVVDDPLVDGNKYLVVKAGQTTAAYKDLTLEPNQLYMLTLRAKGYIATVNVNSSAVATFYPSGAAARQTKNDANKWNTLTLRFRTKTEGTLADVLSFAANQYGDTFIDDISLVKVPALTGISLSVDSNEIAPNNSLQLTAKPIPSDSFIEGKVTWATTDETILSVSSAGRLLAGKEGNATITATVEGFAPATLDMKVTYYAPLLRNGDFADATDMESWWSTKNALNITQFAIIEGIGENGSNGLKLLGDEQVYYNSLDMVLIPNNVYKLTVRYKSNAISPQNQRIWTNFGPAVFLKDTKGEWVTVEKVFTVPSNWLPTGYQVSILADSGSEDWENVVIDSIDVRMFDSGVDATLVTLNPPATTLTPGQSLTYMMATTPSNANTNFMTWTSSNPDVVTVDNGTILAVGGGTATITATVPTSTGSVKAVATVTVEGVEAIIKNGSFDVEGDNSWTITGAAVQQGIGINNSNAVVFGSGSVATQTVTALKPGTVYILRLRSKSVGSLGATLKIKQDGANAPIYSSSVPTVAGWADSSFEFVVPDSYDGSPVTFEMAATGSGTSLILDNVSITEGYSDADLIVSDIMWNNGETQMKPGTPVNFTVVIGNVGTEATKANRDIVVEIRVNTKTIRTFVHKGGILAEEMVALTTDPNDPWLAEEGELVISVHVNTTLTVLESNNKNNGMQTFVRVADEFLEAPQLALNGGFNSLTFSDDFDTANVDTKFTGDYGYKWYMTDLNGMSGDETDFRLTGNSTMILEGKNMNYNWLLCSMDAKTGAGWLGFTHGYLEFRTRFEHNAQPDAKPGIKAPAIWSFPPQAIAPKIYPKAPGEVHVEMDWMEYWGDEFGKMHWTVTMHEQADNGKQWMVNHGSHGVSGAENDIGDGEWHTVGYRWEKGIVITYLDGREVQRQAWGPNGGNPPFNLQSGEFRDNAMMQMDNQTNALILAGTKGWPMEIDYIRVWQADGTVDSKPILDSTFLEDHLTDENGDYFLDVNADNYEAIINAMDAWLALNNDQQTAINEVLIEKGGKEYGELLFEAQTLLQTVETFVSFYACDEYGDPYMTVDETNYEWILTAAEEWDSLTDVEREAINNKVLELCGMTFEDMLAAALNFGEGGGEGNEEEIPSPEDGVPFPAVALVGLVLGGAAMIAGKKRRDEE